jgi:hypothetical protein
VLPRQKRLLRLPKRFHRWRSRLALCAWQTRGFLGGRWGRDWACPTISSAIFAVTLSPSREEEKRHRLAWRTPALAFGMTPLLYLLQRRQLSLPPSIYIDNRLTFSVGQGDCMHARRWAERAG